MKDIDFDELDKAVNSLMASTPPAPAVPADETKPETVVELPTAEPASTPTVSVASKPATVPVATTPTPVAPSPTPTPPAPSPNPVQRAAAPAVRRSGGRFMDMVQKRPAPAAPTRAGSREGLAITPPLASAETEPAPVAPTEAAEPTPASTSTPGVATGNMPDPLDMPSAAPVSDEPAVSGDTPPVEPADPIESPFLADAKVEKRPLNAGSPAPDSTPAPVEPPIEDENNETADSDSSVDPATTETDEPPVNPQVPELSSDLVAIESDKAELTQATETADAAEQVPAPQTPLGTTSIAQQYTAKESSGDQSHAAIYDATQYPEPVAHPAKHRSGWLWVLWVVILLGIGAGGAVVMYNLGII